MQRIVRYAFVIPATYVCLKPNVAKAYTMPSSVKEQLDKFDEGDRAIVKEKQIQDMIKWWGAEYESVIRGMQNNEKLIDELDYIRVMYVRPPLPPSRRIALRSKITSLIEKNKLAHTEYEFLMYILTFYGCI